LKLQVDEQMMIGMFLRPIKILSSFKKLSSSLRQEKFYKPLKEHVGLQGLGSVPGRGLQDLVWFSVRYRNVGLNMVKFCPLISDIQIYLLTVK